MTRASATILASVCFALLTVAESRAADAVFDIGVTADTFRAGDLVNVSGSPGRSQSNILYLWRLDRPADGLRYQQVGGTPSLIKASR